MRLIDVDALIRQLETQDYSGAPDTLEDWTPQDMTKAEIADIQNAPTIEAEPIRHGEWKSDRLVTTNGGTYGVRRCSECEAYYQDIGYGWNYCPNCGAHMDKGEVDI